MKNQKEEAPIAFYTERFSSIDPVAASERCGAAYDGRFALTVLGVPVFMKWPEGTLEVSSGSPQALNSNAVRILLLRYICDGVAAPTTGRFLAYREFPWGTVYDSNFHGRCILRLARTFNSDGFRYACSAAGGKELDYRDVSFELEFLPGLFVRLVYCEGDSEFPPTSQILFSDNFSTAFSAEDMAVIGEIIIKYLRDISRNIVL